ncbi:hypothetical protein [Bacillus changyiensis]|nr:hypothetical protein [Bacillus changyiensis]MDA1478255.1 hypothetical protein [Bacillus changyiensis]
MTQSSIICMSLAMDIRMVYNKKVWLDKEAKNRRHVFQKGTVLMKEP